jgi:hypothetical protein
MVSITTHLSEGAKAGVVFALLAASVVVAAFVAQADLSGRGARIAAETAHKIADEHKSVCQRLGYADRTSEDTRCLEELMRLKRWHDELSAAQNGSIL